MKKKKTIKQYILIYLLPNILWIFWIGIAIFGVNIAGFFKNQYVKTGQLFFLIFYGLMWQLKSFLLWIPGIGSAAAWTFLLCEEHKNKIRNKIIMKAVIPLAVILISVLLLGTVPIPFDGYVTPYTQKMNMGCFICAVIKDCTTKETLTIDVDSCKLIKNKINERRKGISRNVENVRFLVLEKEGYQIPLFKPLYEIDLPKITIHKYTGLIIPVE